MKKLFSIFTLFIFALVMSCGESQFDAGKAPVKAQPLTDKPNTVNGAVTKGSFTVYTIPADPQPKQDYDVVIEVKLPASATNYSASDLSGCVIGTDKYVYVMNRGTYTYGLSKSSIGAGGLLGGYFNTSANGLPQVVNSCTDLNSVPDTAFVDLFAPSFVGESQKATFKIRIPGAAVLVKDRIQVQSTLLNESQNFDITF